MHLIVFFTNSGSLTAIGVSFPWGSGTNFHPFKINPDQDNEADGRIGERQIWVVSDEIPFSELEPQLDALPLLDEVYYVYHNLPLAGFLVQLDAYLAARGSFRYGQFSRQIPNGNSLFEEIRRHPFSAADFDDIVERICPCKYWITRMMNQLNHVSNMLEDKVDLPDFPLWVRARYETIMAGATRENFERKRAALKKELEQYCREKGRS